MRIFFVTNNYTPYSGGVIQSINAMTDELQKQGHEVFIITLNFLGAHEDDPAHVIRLACPIKFVYKKNYMAIPWRPTHAISKLIAQYNPDIIHVHHPFLLGVNALRAARKKNIPCLFTYHTLYEHYVHYIPFAQAYIKPLVQMVVLRFCNKVDAIIAPSTAVKDYLALQNIAPPMMIIPSPLRKCFTPQATPQNILPINRFSLLFVGRFMPEKNIPFIFELMKLLPQSFHCTLAGYGAEYEKIINLAFHTYHLSPEQIHFIHQPPEETLLKLYRTAHLFIFPSTTDTQGIVLAESMSQAVPVIALDGPGQQDIIRNGFNGFIIKNSADAAEKIKEIANNSTLHAHLRAGARETATHYFAEIIIKKLLTLYRQIKN